MRNYIYQNNLIGKKQLRQLLAWSFTNYNSMQACALADELKYLGFKYATQAGISISIEDLKIPFIKNLMLEKANQEIIDAEKIYFKGKITDVERFQKIIDTWSLTSESLKEQVIYFFKNYDPLNSVYIMAFSGARGNLSQVRQLVGMRGLMSDPSGEIMKLPIKKNFREGLTITDYLMSGYGARKGIVDTALKTANSGYLTRRLIDVGQDILIREKDCLATHSFLYSIYKTHDINEKNLIFEKLLGRVLSKTIFDPKTNELIAHVGTQITPKLIEILKKKKITNFYIRSPFTCNLYRAICQKCYGWDLANETLVDIGEAVGILAGQSIGEPGTQLTMRTFHTGGIFTAEARQQILSPVNGIIQFYKILKTVLLRTNRGEDVLITKNSGSIILIPEDKNHNLIKIEVLRNTILFPKNNQYILKDTVIGELINTNKQIKSEVKPILSDNCGEIFMPRLKKKVNLLNNNKLLWILSGQLYNSPRNSFINFYPDYKVNKNSFIFRTKIVNHYRGFVEVINAKQNLYQRLVRTETVKYSLDNAILQKLTSPRNQKNYILRVKNLKYLVQVLEKNSKLYLQLSQNHQLGLQVTNSFKTLTGGIVYYDYRNLLNCKSLYSSISYLNRNNLFIKNKWNSILCYRTMVWLSEEIHPVDCEPNILLVEHGDFISEKFELIPGLFSKTSGIVNIRQKNNLVQTISIKSGLVYEGKKFKNTSKKLYYPGEVLFSNISINTLSFCEQVSVKNNEQLLVRPIEIYEFSYTDEIFRSSLEPKNLTSSFSIQSQSIYSYKPNQSIKGIKNLTLISKVLRFKSNQYLNKKNNIEIIHDQHRNSLKFCLSDRISFNNYITPDLRYKNIQSALLIQQNQFIDQYTTLAYLEAITLNSLEIVKIKIKKTINKPILLISNNDCVILKKKDFPDKKLNSFILTNKTVNSTGKVIIENDNFLTLQKGRPYFFPNCRNDSFFYKTNLQYKLLAPNRIFQRDHINQKITVNYQNIIKFSAYYNIRNTVQLTNSLQKIEWPKLFLKRNGKLYSTLMPQFFRKFSINNPNIELESQKMMKGDYLRSKEKISCKNKKLKLDRTLLLQSSGMTKNQYRSSKKSETQLTLVQFLEQKQPQLKFTKSVGLHSITEDYFEEDANSVFCKSGEFLETGETIGLLNLEKEITGDIVQGLPRIEEILEARKKNLLTKRLPTSQKKGLLIQQTSLDPNFEFRKLGTAIKENERINPHKLLKVYFNYYGLIKSFICDRTNKIKYSRLLQNYEGSYKSFKKVQSFILNSVQSVYQSQGVTINDKHLEVIIKQMTTKVLITYEGNTPLLRREVLDLYHIQYINKVIKSQRKQPAYYVPLLLGITKAALNNPSFISAASFQETTRVLTKAAIEGRIDWLRGLKENIIIGHLIPAGTGSQNYRNCFRKVLSQKHIKLSPSQL